jgi:cytochrome c peroxidase
MFAQPDFVKGRQDRVGQAMKTRVQVFGEVHDLHTTVASPVWQRPAGRRARRAAVPRPQARWRAGRPGAQPARPAARGEYLARAADCVACHSGPNFTDNGFHNIGLPSSDEGRVAISKSLGDKGAFKTPTLREIAKTAPYMHDGSLKTIEEVIAHYVKGGTPNPQLDEELFPLKLSPEEISDLITFLKDGLSSTNYPAHTAPELPK